MSFNQNGFQQPVYNRSADTGNLYQQQQVNRNVGQVGSYTYTPTLAGQQIQTQQYNQALPSYQSGSMYQPQTWQQNYNSYYPNPYLYGSYNLNANTNFNNMNTAVNGSGYNTYTSVNTNANNQNVNQSYDWVQGEAGAKAHPVNPGTSKMLMDSEGNVFYIKTVDINGVPLPLRMFDYKERVSGDANEQQNNRSEIKEETSREQLRSDYSSEYITREEFENRLNKLILSDMQRGVNNDESAVQSSIKQQRDAKPTKQYNKHASTV